MRRGAIWGLMFGFLAAATPGWAAPPEPVSEGPTLPSYEAPLAPPIDVGTGIASHRKHRAWTRGQLDASLRPRMLPTFSLLPGVRPDRVGDVGGFSLGFSGRF